MQRSLLLSVRPHLSRYVMTLLGLATATVAGLLACAPVPFLPCSDSTRPPAPALISPLNGAALTGTITTIVQAGHDCSGLGVVFLSLYEWPGGTHVANLGQSLGGSQPDTYSVTWSSAGFANGTYSLVAFALYGQRGTDRSIQVTIANP